jgi:hypothetical protein
MLLDKMTDKRIKISAYSPEFDVPQLFVINGTPTDIANVHVKLEKLISKLKQSSNRKRPLGEDCRKDDLRYILTYIFNTNYFKCTAQKCPE